MFSEYEINTLPLSLKSSRQRVERFLTENGLRLDDIDTYAVVSPIDSDEILAGGGIKGDLIKCLAVSEQLRGTGMMQRLISHLLSIAHSQGCDCVKVFTKPENRDIFESLGFTTLAEAPKAIFMENGMSGIKAYVNKLRTLHSGKSPQTCGIIVMNANPFTLGHKALVEWAAAQVATLYVVAVKEDLSLFSSTERLEMMRNGCRHINNVVVCEGSDYAISAKTFPTYFLKKIDDATDTHITLDLDLLARHIAPALNATIRFVGSEPTDALTARYVELMKQILPQHGIEVRVMERITHGHQPVSASVVRQHLAHRHFNLAAQLVPQSTVPFLIAHLACNALECELDTTPKPGLIDRDDNGAHTDMTYSTMQNSIKALRPFFNRLTAMGTRDTMPAPHDICNIGIEAERAMLAATAGVNTHRGALFALGLTALAAAHTHHRHNQITAPALRSCIGSIAGLLPGSKDSHGDRAVTRHHVDGALAMARKGYEALFDCWLPFYRSLSSDTLQPHKTLLLIISQLDDTNVIHRCGYDKAQLVKQQAAELLNHFSTEGLRQMNSEFIAQNISPGGAADMLSLTMFIDSILCENK